MRILMPFLGSRGDVQPGIALAAELVAQGHDVDFGAPPNLQDFARRAGFDAFAAGPDTGALLESELVTDGITSRNPVRLVRSLTELNTLGWQELSQVLDDRASRADVIVTCLVGQEVGYAVAEKHRIPAVAVHYFPVRPNRAVPLLDTSVLPHGLAKVADRAAWSATRWGWRAITRSGENAMRATLGLDAAYGPIGDRMAARGWPEIQAIDPALFPGLQQDWGSQRPLTGFFDLPESIRAAVDSSGHDIDLDRWLADGPPPVYWGFGSMRLPDPATTADLVETVTQTLGIRSLVSAGWSKYPRTEGANGNVFYTGAVDHAAVLPRCVVAVHHGGAGTTAATLRAGIPSVVATFGTADQPVWGRMLQARGVGAATAFARLDETFLREALTRLASADAQAKAKSLAVQLISASDSVKRAAGVVVRVSESVHRFS